jgi:uncharacterized protein (TIGR03790 family)
MPRSPLPNGYLGLLALLALLLVVRPVTAREVQLRLEPVSTLGPETLAVVINQADPASVEVGEYYAARRGLPAANVVRVRFTAGAPVLGVEEFARVWAEVETKTPPEVQAYALAWTLPYRVGCMSVTSAFAFGFDEAFCAQGCKPTRQSPYFQSSARRPQKELGLRPAMLLAGTSVAAAKRTIDQGLAADGTRPPGTAYLLSTSDRARNVRSAFYPEIGEKLGAFVRVETLEADTLTGRDDVLFYFTGKVRVPDLATLGFRPGAIADHLTSNGGVLLNSPQMSALEWLDAGATASYGTVVEPCAFPQKFPHPGVVIARYLSGETLIEAYWKSVAWPGQGVFVGEPLARPYPSFRFVLE